ncbi:MAG: histidine kinase [Acidimicrobiales bacterium]|nr:histidine kinase [Acidimicrobiales bacterium]
MTRRTRRLSAQILAGQVIVLVVAGLAGLALYVRHTRDDLDRQFEQRALTVAQAAAADPDIRAAMVSGDRDATVARIAEDLRKATAASYVVVIDAAGGRHSHPNPTLIGKRIEEPVVALDGRTHVGIDHGHLGRSANGKAPLRAPDGRIIGEVSAGILETQISSELWRQVPTLVLSTIVALAAGVAISLLLARRLKRRTFGLELDEIAELLQEREAMLHGIREGVVILDPAGRVSLVNDEACRLLDLHTTQIGRVLHTDLPPGRLRDLVAGAEPTVDEVVVTDDRCLTVARMPVSLGGRPLGAVITVRDQTELVSLLRELDSVRALTDALRAQQHEHANRMHTVAGLLELGRTEEAATYVHEIAGTSAARAEVLQERIGEPMVVALLLGKFLVAAEVGVSVDIEADDSVESITASDIAVDPAALVTILGNLVDNAIDAAQSSEDKTVRVRFGRAPNGDVTIEVSDSGPGIAGGAADVFVDGFTTKPPRPDGVHRGLGLALVRRLVVRAGGEIDVEPGPGATFVVRLPVKVAAGRR